MSATPTEGRRIDWDPVTHYQDVAVAERYDHERFSSLSGKAYNALEKHYIDMAFRDVAPGSLVLDLPCGTGRLAGVLLKRGLRVVGADVSPVMLEVARRKLRGYADRFTTEVIDVFNLPADPTPRYDAALCARVLMHFPLDEQIRFLRAVARFSKGPVIFTQSLSTGYLRLRRRVKTVLRNNPPAGYPITNAELQQLLRGAGLIEERRLRPSRLISEAVIVIARRREV